MRRYNVFADTPLLCGGVVHFRKKIGIDLGMDVVELRFTHEALLAVAQKAATMKTGARGLRGIMEMIMLDVMYRVPSLPEVQGCLIGEEVIKKDAEPLFFYWKKAAHS